MKGVMRFGKKVVLSSRYLGPYKILKRVGKVEYQLELQVELAAVHPVFHISLLLKCVGDPASVVPLESVAVKHSLSYDDVAIDIIDRQVRGLRNKEVASVKVLWRSQFVDGASWEAEAAMKAKSSTLSFLFHSILTNSCVNLDLQSCYSICTCISIVFSCPCNSILSKSKLFVFSTRDCNSLPLFKLV